MHQRVVLPGLVDAHIHLQLYALNREKIDCELPTKGEILNRVAETVKVARTGEWIVGHGWNQNSWGGEWPTASDLDAVAPLNPVYLTAKSLHAGWANSSALRRAKIKKRRCNPAEGIIQRDDRGQPTGILFEKAMNLVEAVIPKPLCCKYPISTSVQHRRHNIDWFFLHLESLHFTDTLNITFHQMRLY